MMDKCRVLDLGIITAGAATSAILADLGAEVIKIESPTYKDPFRKWSGEPIPGEHPDLPPFFRMTNRDKFNAGINLKHPEGRQVFLRLCAHSDIVVENFSRGVLTRLGLGYDALKAVNPDIILASISSQGENGPDASYASFGSTLEAMAGMAAITGYADGAPVISGLEINYPDQVAAIFASSMIVTAWRARGNGAGGAHLDLSQRELTSFLCGENFLRPHDLPRLGNAQPEIPLQDCFRSHDGAWIAVTVDETKKTALHDLIGDISMSSLGQWIATQSAAAAVDALESAGLAAAHVLDGTGVLADRNTGWSRALRYATDGETVKGPVFDDEAVPPKKSRPTVHFGFDTREILRRVGEYSDSDIDTLISIGAVAEADPRDLAWVRS